MKINGSKRSENGDKGRRLSYPKLLAVTGLLVLLSLLLVGCSSYQGGYGGGDGEEGTVMTSTIDMENTSYQPESIEIEAGTEVTWTNQDGVDHTVTSRTGLFDSGTISPGGDFSYTFDQTGTYEYYCSIHPSMEGEIVVKS